MVKSLYCFEKEGTHRVKSWNKEEEYNYFCEKHYPQAYLYNNQEKNRFYEYYKDDIKRSWLPEASFKLWEKIHMKKQK